MRFLFEFPIFSVETVPEISISTVSSKLFCRFAETLKTGAEYGKTSAVLLTVFEIPRESTAEAEIVKLPAEFIALSKIA